MASEDNQQHLLERVEQAIKDNSSLCIVGGNSKEFYGRVCNLPKLDVSTHQGVINYEPTELMLTARAGTSIRQIERILAQHDQMLGFEPPFCNDDSTLGGVVAAGLSGPRRAYSGAVRDFVLGVKMINGEAQVLSFGGRVMKNVAGFDHSRLMCGALGTLGVLLEISLRVIPNPEVEKTISFFEQSPQQAVARFNQIAAVAHPVSATAWCKGVSHIRLSGTEQGVNHAIAKIGGEVDGGEVGWVDQRFWADLTDHRLPEFVSANQVKRISIASASNALLESQAQVIEWNGAQRWWFADLNDGQLASLGKENAQLTHFSGASETGEYFQSLDPVIFRLHQNLKQAFDPRRIFNPGRMYQGL